MSCGKILICFFSLALAVNAMNFQKIEIQTSDCSGCGMTGLFGGLYVKACGEGGQRCCESQSLDSPFENNFVEGGIDVFTHEDTLGECFNFNLGTDTSVFEGMITLHHLGSDGWKGDWAKVYALDGSFTNVYKCYFDQFLDGDMQEAGKSNGICEHLLVNNLTKLNDGVYFDVFGRYEYHMTIDERPVYKIVGNQEIYLYWNPSTNIWMFGWNIPSVNSLLRLPCNEFRPEDCNEEMTISEMTISLTCDAGSTNEITYGLVGGAIALIAVILVAVLFIVKKKKHLQKLKQQPTEAGSNKDADGYGHWNAGSDFDTFNAVDVVSTENASIQANNVRSEVDVTQNPYYGVKNAYSRGVYAIKIIENNYYETRATKESTYIK